MKFYWEQLSPKEREVLLRHFLLKRNLDAPVTAERVCAALKKTHYLACHTSARGKAVIQFVTHKAGANSGTSLADDLSEGIYKAALRAKGVDVEDGLSTAVPLRRNRAGTAARALR